MLFSLTAIDHQGQIRDFSWQVDHIEDGLDVLSIVAARHTLIKAQVIDNGQVTELPLALFDGFPFASFIRELEKEWQQILAIPVKANPGTLKNGSLLSCTVFASTLVGLAALHDLPGILAQSRQLNAQRGITGVMLHRHDRIIQVLEGEEKVVETLYRRIEQDPRHTNVVRVFSGPLTHSLFGEWSMDYQVITAHQLAIINAILAVDMPAELTTTGNNPIILKTLKVVYEHNRLS